MTTAILENLTAPTTTISATPAAIDIPRCDVLGVDVSAVNMQMAVHQIEQWIARREPNYVCITGVHGVMESQHDPRLKQIHNQAGMVTPDGMPMVWVNRLRGNAHVSRVYGPDLMLEVCALSLRRGWRHFFYGGADGVADLLAQRLAERFPGLRVAGTHCPPFRKLSGEEDRAVVQQINASGADVVWVGLSTPKQEYWMHEHLGKLGAPVLVGVGAAFDFHAGLKSQAPRWMQKMGMEWFYRLCSEPRRLWKRYLKNNPLFVYNLALQSLGLKDFSGQTGAP